MFRRKAQESCFNNVGVRKNFLNQTKSACNKTDIFNNINILKKVPKHAKN